MPARARLRLLVATIATGAAAGVAGVALTLLLHGVQHLAFGYTENTFLVGVEQASAWRRVIAVGVGGLVVGCGWWLQRRWADRVGHRNVSVTHALAQPNPHLPVPATTGDAVLQLVGVGAGASLGREGAPRQVGAAFGGVIARWLGLSAEQRRTVLAIGAGAGLAAVYNVPLSGAAFTLELLLVTARPSVAFLALIGSAVATVVAWPVLGDQPTYHLGPVGVTGPGIVLAVVIGALCGPAGLAFRAAMTHARTCAPAGRRAVVATAAAFTGLGALAIRYPQVLGNGKNFAELAFTGGLPLATAAVLVLLKPVATGVCLRAGAIGGLLTPSFSTGAALGMTAAGVWHRLAPHAAGGATTVCALAGAAALLAVAQRARVTAIVLTLEFTHVAPACAIPIAAAVIAAALSERAVSSRQSKRAGAEVLAGG